MNHNRTVPYYFSLLLLLSTGMESVWAAKWDFSENVLMSIAYTDNVELVEEDKESDWALIISPNFIINGEGNRVSVSMAAALQFVSGSEETFYPRLRASAHSELIKSRFFLDAFASAYQQTINPLKPAGSPINRTGNLTTTYTVGFNPYYLEHFGNIADLRLDYSYQHQFYVNDDVEDREFNDFYFSLNSGSFFPVFNWDIFGSYKKTTYEGDSDSDTTFKSLDIRLGYVLTRSLEAYFTFGREWNTYQSSQSAKGGDKWLVGAVWTPNSRISVDMGYGYRFFGHYPYVNLFYRHKRSALRVSYRHDLESGYIPLDQQYILSETDLMGRPVDPFAGGLLDINNPELVDLTGNGANVNKRLDASYILTGKRTTLSVSGRYSDRTYQDSTRGITEWRLGFNLYRQLARQLSAQGHTTWYRTEDKTDARADTWDLGFMVTRGLGDHTNLTFSYTYSQRDSTRPHDDYTENRMALVLRTTMIGLAKHADLF
jgi:uncharacterized protein (PEP-CTERM system associated)